MLSDAIREARRDLDEYRGGPVEMAPEVIDSLLMRYRAWEIEARNMEERLAGLDAIGHVPILPMDGKVVPFRARPS